MVALDAEGSPLGDVPSLAAGQQITIKASGFLPHEAVTETVFSTPTFLGNTNADAFGLVNYLFQIPSDLPAGAHTLALKGASLTSFFAFRIGVSPMVAPPATSLSGGRTAPQARLPHTGTNTIPLLLGGLLFLWAGAMVILHIRPSAASTGRHRPQPSTSVSLG